MGSSWSSPHHSSASASSHASLVDALAAAKKALLDEKALSAHALLAEKALSAHALLAEKALSAHALADVEKSRSLAVQSLLIATQNPASLKHDIQDPDNVMERLHSIAMPKNHTTLPPL
jgi:hypothetical protein